MRNALRSVLAAVFIASAVTAQPGPKPSAMSLSDLRKAAQQGNAEAQFELGMRSYYQHDGLHRDEAGAWIRKAAEQGTLMLSTSWGLSTTQEKCRVQEALFPPPTLVVAPDVFETVERGGTQALSGPNRKSHTALATPMQPRGWNGQRRASYARTSPSIFLRAEGVPMPG
jgi:hypothetical protein